MGVCRGFEGVDFLSFGDLGRSLGTTLLQDWLTGGSGTDFGPSGGSLGSRKGLFGGSWGVFLGDFVVIMGQMSGHVVGFALRTLFEHHFGRKVDR